VTTPNQENQPSGRPGNINDGLERALRSSSALTVEQFRKVLRDRARNLAQEEEKDELSDADAVHVLQFVLGSELYAFEGNFVREVRVAMDVTPIPCTPTFVSGVVNLRGEIVTVLDTKLLLGLSSTNKTLQKLVIVRTTQGQVAFLIDDVVGVAPVSRKELQGPLATMPTEQARRVSGLTGGPMVLIDVEALMSDPRIVVDEEVYD
jgi:purine-binding chemotaxis protein CheW